MATSISGSYTKRKFSSSRSPTRSAMAQMARHPSVHMTDITPAHTAATLRPDRHHTHGHQVAILGWRLYEAYRLRSFLSFTARPGRAVGKLRCWAHAPPMGACAQMLGVAWAWPGRAVDAQKGGGVVCASRRHQQVEVIERPARARDGWRCRQQR